MRSPRSGFSLVVAGLLGVVFFWATDPRYGLTQSSQNLVDAANQAQLGTIVGIAGSVVVLLIGLWLLSRRAI